MTTVDYHLIIPGDAENVANRSADVDRALRRSGFRPVRPPHGLPDNVSVWEDHEEPADPEIDGMSKPGPY